MEGLAQGGGGKKNSARRNAWGNMSYADLITQAILNSPDKRLTLSQIYDWMVQNVPYFRDKGDSNSSAGWKNSIRHNLSLHSRFMRIQNEGAGKSSWWVINPDAKPGKGSRRRVQTMDNPKSMEKKRGRVRKKVEQLRNAALVNAQSAVNGGGGGDMSPVVSESSEFSSSVGGFSSSGEFRVRSNSTLSTRSNISLGRLSPQPEENFDDFPWGLGGSTGLRPTGQQQDLNQDIMEMAGSMRLGDPQSGLAPNLIGGAFPDFKMAPDSKPPPPSYNQATSNTRFQPASMIPQQQQSSSPLKLEPSLGPGPCSLNPCGAQGQQISPSFRQVHIPPTGNTPLKPEPPAYQELYPTTYGKIQGNPALRDALKPSNHHQYQGIVPGGYIGMDPPNGGYQGGLIFPPGPPGTLTLNSNGQALPQDIQDVNYDTNLQCDIDAVMRHELNVAGNIDFNMDTFGNC
jgi:forkhead box protein O3